jgi:hypothetical protein
VTDFDGAGADEFQLIGAGGQGQLQFIKSDSPAAVAERIKAIVNRINSDYLHLGREIYKVFHRRMYLDLGYSTFDECMAAEFGISKERADRVRRVWTKFVKELCVKPEELDGVGFQRAFTLLPVVTTDNAHDLIARAKSVGSAKELQAHVDLLKGKPKALDHARDSAALVEETTTADHPSPERSASGRLPTPAPAVEQERPTKVTFNLYPSQREIVDAAIAEVQRNKTGGGLMAPNEALAHVALGFMADRLTRDERPNAQVRFYLNWFERVYGGKFVWITNDEAAAVLTKAIEEHSALFPQQGKTTVQKETTDEHPDDPAPGG